MQEALIQKAESVRVNTDSQLLYRQMNKEYKIKHPKILALYNQAAHLISSFKKVCFTYIPREQNRGADKLASGAIKEALKKNRSLR